MSESDYREDPEIEWLRGKVAEAQSDPVGLWQLVKAGRERFRLDGADLERFVFRSVEALVRAGAFPVKGDTNIESGWLRQAQYGSEPAAIATAIVREWKHTGRDPDFGDVWFAMPSAFLR